MSLRYAQLIRHPTIFVTMTGLHRNEFDALADEILPLHAQAQRKRLQRPQRKRAMGAGHPFELAPIDQLLLTLVWLRHYPINAVLGYLFEVSESTARRAVLSMLPLLEQSGRDSLRMPEPNKRQRRSLDTLLTELPALLVIVDSFEQRVQRPPARSAADRYYSGKKKQHTLKSQVTVNHATGEICDVSASVEGPTADMTLLKQSDVLARLPPAVGVLGDLAYVGTDKLHPARLGFTPRRKPRGQPRPAADVAYNTAFSKQRIVVEHAIGRLRRYEALDQTDRHHRRHHAERVMAVAGLVNRQIRQRCLN
ncbi:MAG TPA: transposase family protein [Rhodocyclaceae bacterium]